MVVMHLSHRFLSLWGLPLLCSLMSAILPLDIPPWSLIKGSWDAISFAGSTLIAGLFSLLWYPHPLLDTRYHRILQLQGAQQIPGPCPRITKKKIKIKLRRQKRICPEWLSQLVSKLRPELWSPQPLRSSLPKHLLGPTVCWPLCYILGTWKKWLQRFFPIEACHQSELAWLKKQ